MKSAIDAGVPALVLLAMFVVGTDLTVDDFRRVARQPKIVLAAIAGQIVLLPLLGWILVRWMDLQPAIAQGLLLVTACPSGAMANVYTQLARANVALSVTLTAVSCLTAVVATPMALFALQTQFGESNVLAVPIRVLAAQLLLLLVLPVVAGMGFRSCWPALAAQHRGRLMATSVVILVALLGLVIAQEGKHFLGAVGSIAITVPLLTCLAFGAGWITGWLGGAGSVDRFTVGVVFVVRNVGIATAIAVTALGRVEFAVFATAYFLVQVPLVLGGILLFRYLTPHGGTRLASGERS